MLKKRLVGLAALALLSLSMSFSSFAVNSRQNPGGGGGSHGSTPPTPGSTPIPDPDVPLSDNPGGGSGDGNEMTVIDDEEVPLAMMIAPKTGESNILLLYTAAGMVFAGAAFITRKKLAE